MITTITRGMASGKREFVLKNVNINELNKKFGLLILGNIEESTVAPVIHSTPSSVATTQINDVLEPEPMYAVSFLDDKKNEVPCLVSMFEFVRRGELPSEANGVRCFWDQHEFSSRPIGCPVQYVHSSIEKSYVSHITKDEYCIRENLTRQKLRQVTGQNQPTLNCTIAPYLKCYYVVDGMFCSFNCVMAYIEANQRDPFYRDSEYLLRNMYRALTGKEMPILTTAPHWRLLKCYGGAMSIDEFRRTFSGLRKEYTHRFTVSECGAPAEQSIDPTRGVMRPLAHVYTEKKTGS